MQDLTVSLLCPGRWKPRQFEFHPTAPGVTLFGTLKGEAIVADGASNSVMCQINTGVSNSKRDSILGLCWLRRHESRFVVGSSHG
jgi:hypothetical protein